MTTYWVRQDGDDANDGSANDAAHAWEHIYYAVETGAGVGDHIKVVDVDGSWYLESGQRVDFKNGQHLEGVPSHSAIYPKWEVGQAGGYALRFWAVHDTLIEKMNIRCIHSSSYYCIRYDDYAAQDNSYNNIIRYCVISEVAGSAHSIIFCNRIRDSQFHNLVLVGDGIGTGVLTYTFCRDNIHVWNITCKGFSLQGILLNIGSGHYNDYNTAGDYLSEFIPENSHNMDWLNEYTWVKYLDFQDEVNWDYRLKPNSVLIDTGRGGIYDKDRGAYPSGYTRKTEHWVSPDGNDDALGTEDSPWQTIDYAVEHKIWNETLHVEAGTYILTERLHHRFSGSIIEGVPKAQWNQDLPIIQMQDVAQSFLIRECNGAKIKNIRFDLRNATQEYPIYVWGAAADNRADGYTFERCVIEGEYNGGYAAGINIGYYNDVKFLFCTIYKIKATNGIQWVSADDGIFDSCILHSVIVKGTGCGGLCEYKYSDTYDCSITGFTDGGHNINVDPKLIDPDNGNFRLQDVSPCIDEANPAYDSYDDPKVGNHWDMGAYEWGGVPPTPPGEVIVPFEEEYGIVQVKAGMKVQSNFSVGSDIGVGSGKFKMWLTEHPSFDPGQDIIRRRGMTGYSVIRSTTKSYERLQGTRSPSTIWRWDANAFDLALPLWLLMQKGAVEGLVTGPEGKVYKKYSQSDCEVWSTVLHSPGELEEAHKIWGSIVRRLTLSSEENAPLKAEAEFIGYKMETNFDASGITLESLAVPPLLWQDAEVYLGDEDDSVYLPSYSVTLSNNALIKFFGKQFPEDFILQDLDIVGTFILPWFSGANSQNANKQINDFLVGIDKMFKIVWGHHVEADLVPGDLAIKVNVRYTGARISRNNEIVTECPFEAIDDGVHDPIEILLNDNTDRGIP